MCLDTQPCRWLSHQSGGKLPLLSVKRALTYFPSRQRHRPLDSTIPYKMSYLDPMVTNGKPRETVWFQGFCWTLITSPQGYCGYTSESHGGPKGHPLVYIGVAKTGKIPLGIFVRDAMLLGDGGMCVCEQVAQSNRYMWNGREWNPRSLDRHVANHYITTPPLQQKYSERSDERLKANMSLL